MGDGLRERVGGVLLAEPLQQVVTQPPRGLHRRHEDLMALRIEQDPAQLLHVRRDEVEQRGTGQWLNGVRRGRDGGFAARDQLGDDGRIGLDRSGRAAEQGPRRTLIRERSDEVVAFEDGP